MAVVRVGVGEDRPVIMPVPNMQTHPLNSSLCGILRVAFTITMVCSSSCTLQALAFQTTHPSTACKMFRRHDDNQLSDRMPVKLILHHPARVYSAITDSKSIELSINESIKELEALQRERSPSGTSIPSRQNSLPSPKSETSNAKIYKPRRSKSPSPNQPQQRVSIKFIRSKPVGELTPSELRSLCNSIRYNRDESSFFNLEILERILLELDFKHKNAEISEKGTVYLKRLQVFSILTALSNEVRSWKRDDQSRTEKKMAKRPKICKIDIQRLVKVVTLLKKNRHSRFIDAECFNKDVPSFATMIAAEASRYEASAVDAAFIFLDMVEEADVDPSEEWDSRIIGAVLDALARHGRAEEAQNLLGRAMGLNITSFGDTIKNTTETHAVSTFSRKRLSHIHAGPCYDALIRSWSKRAMLSADEKEPDNANTKRRTRERNGSLSSRISIQAQEALSQARHILLYEMPELELTITNRTINAVLHGYSTLGMGSESESLLMEMETLQSSPPLSSIRSSILDVGCYNTVLHGYYQDLHSNNVTCAERLFTAMKNQQPLSSSTMNFVTNRCDAEDVQQSPFLVIPPRPDFISYSSMIKWYCKNGMVIKAEELLDEMFSSPFKPTSSCYLPIFQALEVSKESDAPQRVLSLIERPLPKPSRLLYVAALKCMKHHGRGDEAEIIIEKFRNSHSGRAGPDMYAHMLVLRAWEKTASKSDRLTASRRSESRFKEMQKLVDTSQLPAMDVNAYNCLLNCYARAGEAEKAEQLLATMESSCNDPNIQPTSKSFSLAIKALSNSDSVDAVHRAWNILTRLGHPHGSPLEQVKIYNSMLRLFAKRGMATEAEALLNRMDEIVDGAVKAGPDIQSYEAVLEALGRCGDADAPARAEALVTRLEVMSELGGYFQPSLLAYNSLLNCYANAGIAGKAERTLERLHEADSYSYGSTIKAIANSGKSQIVSMARAESLSDALGVGNEVIFTHRLKLCQKWGLGDEAEQLLREMQEQNLKPSIIHFTAALNAWAKSVDDDALSRAEDLFEVMEGICELDRASFHGLLLNYSTRGIPEKADHLLRRMMETPNITPNRASFTMVIDSYARSNSKTAGQQAEALLDQMREMHAAGYDEVEPDHVTYSSVIKCKLLSKNQKINTLSKLDKLQMMKELQLESWPF